LAAASVRLLCAGKLQDHTTQAFNDHIRKAEAGFDERLRNQSFLWVDRSPAALKQVRAREVAIAPVVGKGEVHVRDGLIHDWVGAVFIPNASLDQVLAAQQNYNNHKNTHRPEVLDSKLLRRDGNDYKVYLRVSKSKATVTAVLNTEHQVHYSRIDGTRWEARSYSTRITQLKDPGETGETELPEGNDSGYLWRLNSYWRYAGRDGGVYVECEAVSLTRDVPWGVSWIIVPIIRSLPRESLRNTLESTRNAVLAQRAKPPDGASQR